MSTNNINSAFDRELDWNDSIEKDSNDFILLPEGDYNFRVTTFERGRHNGSEKLPACNKAIIHLEILAPEGTVKIQHSLFLHTKTEGLLSAFFSSIGQKKKGEKLQMNWQAVSGATGRAKIGVRNWTATDGAIKQSNDISKFYPKEEQPAPATYKPGRF